MRRLIVVLGAVLALTLLVASVSAAQQDGYPPPEGPVEVLPTVIERAPAPAVQPEQRRLPVTGTDLVIWAAAAIVLVAGGGAVLTAARRRRDSDHTPSA